MVTTDNNTWRIGNQLFVAACAYAYARKYNHEVLLPEKFELLNTFLNEPVEIVYDNKQSFINIPEKGFEYQPIPEIRDTNICIHGYRQSYKYWWAYSKYILSRFRAKPGIYETCNAMWEPVKNMNKPTVAIHFRLTDYLQLKDHHTCLMETDYYEKAIQQFDAKEVLFAVFSDDKKQAFAYMKTMREKYGINYIILENTTDIQDLILMSKCKHHIVSNSSFSWWGCALSVMEEDKTEQKLIMPKNWFGIEYTKQGWDANDLYLPNTMVL